MEANNFKIIGPFYSLLTMEASPMRGPINNDKLVIKKNVGILVENGLIREIDAYDQIIKKYKTLDASHSKIEEVVVGLPGLVDSHTHACFGGSRHLDYAARNEGISYLEIARKGGGIWDTVLKTRKSSVEELLSSTKERVLKMTQNGITTAEIKSGYGLNVNQELKQLKIINAVNKVLPTDIISTCLAAHIKPKDFGSSSEQYLTYLINELLPLVKREKLSNRVDLFFEEDAFSEAESRMYLNSALKMGFDITIHGDQFSTGGSKLAVELGAKSVDHLEASAADEIRLLGLSNTVATVLPGASIGLGCNFAPARKQLDAGAILAIASDWNPGSAPMGDLVTQSSILGASEKLTDAEVFAGITYRAAQALGLNDRGRLKPTYKSDICAFAIKDYREILYHQGQIKPHMVWKEGIQIT